jgi:hypothetical protein
MLVWLFMACASNILAQYEDERTTVLAAPPPYREPWSPEVQIRLSEDALADIVDATLDAGLLSWKKTLSLPNPLGVETSVTPSAHVDSLALDTDSNVPGCSNCIGLKAKLSGKAAWKAGPLKGKVPFSAQVSGTIKFTMKKDSKNSWTAQGTIREISTIKVSVADFAKIDAGDLLEGWTKSALKKTPPVPLGTFGGESLPLRATKISRTQGAVMLSGLTNVSGSVPVRWHSAPPKSDWAVAIHPTTIAAMARRSAFAKGVLEAGIAIDPRSLSMEGDRFGLGLRVWRLTGRGWWRDYQVNGNVTLEKGKLKFTPTETTEDGKSPGAGLTDPLALLAEGMILKEVEKGVAQTIPARKVTAIGDQQIRASASRVWAKDNVLLIAGSLTRVRASKK